MSQPPWSTLLSEMIIDPKVLGQKLALPEAIWLDMLQSHRDFPLRVPKRWLDKITPGDLNHPLLRQILPTAQEQNITPDYSTDPLAEKQANPVPGLLHKYHGRVLIIAAPSCAIHCRYCFRRHFNYDDNQKSQKQWAEVLNYIRNDQSIHEVILSGGDPLMLKNTQLQALIAKIETIAHVQTLRIHSRIPVILPERIDDRLVQILTSTRLNVCLVVHTNHALELDQDVEKTFKNLHQAGIILLNQSVLLADVNNNIETLVALSHRLWQCRVLPYYLHMPDKVQGTAHFNVTTQQAKHLMRQLNEQLPGYMVPKLAQEIPGMPTKKTITN